MTFANMRRSGQQNRNDMAMGCSIFCGVFLLVMFGIAVWSVLSLMGVVK